MEDVNLIGVGVIGADSYVEPAVSASQKIISRFGHKRHEALTVSQSDSRGKNPFPIKWRMDAFSIDALPILNEYSNQIKISNNNAVDDLINKLSTADNPVTLLFTGPLTDPFRKSPVLQNISTSYFGWVVLLARQGMLMNLVMMARLNGMSFGTLRHLKSFYTQYFLFAWSV